MDGVRTFDLNETRFDVRSPSTKWSHGSAKSLSSSSERFGLDQSTAPKRERHRIDVYGEGIENVVTGDFGTKVKVFLASSWSRCP